MEKTREELLKEAKSLGLTPHHATGVKKLQEMIKTNPSKEDKELIDYDNKTNVEDPIEEVSVTPIFTRAQRIANLKAVQKRLVRVIVRCNNENKKERTGETITVICAAGTLKRFIPFDNENGWHVEQALLDVLQAKKCPRFRTVKLPNGQDHRVAFTVKEYSIEFLPALDEEQLEKLAEDQSARGSID